MYKTWFWLDAVESTIVGGTQVCNSTKYAMTRYVDTVNNCTQGHGLKTTKTHAPLHMDYNLRNFGCESNHIKNVKKPSRNMQ